jgi:hypothetical protein
MILEKVCSLTPWIHFFAIVVVQLLYMIFEAWLGKTDKVKAASFLELIWDGIKAILNINKGE